MKKPNRRHLLLVLVGHVLAALALVLLHEKTGSVAGVFSLAAVLLSATLFGLRGALLSAFGQVALNSLAVQLWLDNPRELDGSALVGLLLCLVFGAAVGNQRDLFHRLREELRQNQALRTRERELLLAIPDALLRVSVDGSCQLRAEVENRSLEEALGLVLGRHLPQLQQDTLRDTIATARGTQTEQALALEQTDAVYDVRAFPCADSTVLLVVRDVTEQRRLLRRATSAEHLSSLGTLAAGLAHEINNPLTYIISNLTSLEASLDSPEQKADLTAALEGCWRIRDLVCGMLDTAATQKEAGEPVFVGDAIQAALTLATPQTRHRATVQCQLDDGLYVRAHRTKLIQVIVNLLTNASHSFLTNHTEVNQIRIRAFSQGGSVIIEVNDNGAGMDEPTRLHAMEPFFTTKEPGLGTGLGLFLCNSIMESSKGKLQLDSEPGRGTKVTLVFPAAEEPAPASHVAGRISLAPRVSAHHLRILVVDDEPPIRRVVSRILQARHVVSCCSNGTEALQWITAGERYDLIFCDLLMPEMTGIELFTELLQRFPDQAERMVFLTGGATSEAARQFIDLHRDRVVKKPFRTRDIEDRVRLLGAVS